MMRRAERREAEVVAMEAAYRLEELELELACRAPDQEMEELGKAIFAQPAATMADAQVQARMLCAFEATSGAYNKAHLINVWGMVLAKGLVQIGAAA